MMRILTTVILAVFLYGCASQQVYEGAKRHPDQIAHIKPGFPSFFSFDPAIHITEIDGGKRDFFSSGKFDVAPGTHTIKAAQLYNLFGLKGKFVPKIVRTITFEARAGESYVVYYRWRNRREGKWVIIVTEESTGRVFREK